MVTAHAYTPTPTAINPTIFLSLPRAVCNMGDHNLLALLGPTPDSYFITYGRKIAYENAPDDIVQTFTKEPDMNPMSVKWLR